MVMKIIKYIIQFSIIVFLHSCCPIPLYVEVEELKGWGFYQKNNNLRVDGYFYHQWYGNYDNIRNWTFVVLYNNGIFNGFFSVDYKYNQDIDSTITGIIESKLNTKLPYVWGSYVISNDTILFYRVIGMHSCTYPIQEQKALIGKDKESFYVIHGKDNTLDTFKFRPLANKPDSNNILFKNEYLKEQMKKGYEEYLKRPKKE